MISPDRERVSKHLQILLTKCEVTGHRTLWQRLRTIAKACETELLKYQNSLPECLAKKVATIGLKCLRVFI